jgi:6,7-dimethyl-8-ribityllumazine synthase
LDEKLAHGVHLPKAAILFTKSDRKKISKKMASALKNLSSYDDSTLPSAADMHFGIVVADWNAEITHALYQGCYDTLVKHGAIESNVHTVQVPGTFELPVAARILNGQKKVDGLICIGCVIKGETKHDEYISHAVATGLIQLGLALSKPVIFGVLTPNSQEQAQERAGGKHGNKGVEAAVTAIRMVALQKGVSLKGKIGF